MKHNYSFISDDLGWCWGARARRPHDLASQLSRLAAK